jgi:hypothetical protein
MKTAYKVRALAILLLGLIGFVFFKREELTNIAMGKEAFLAAQANSWERLANHGSVWSEIIASVAITCMQVCVYEAVVWYLSFFVTAMSRRRGRAVEERD